MLFTLFNSLVQWLPNVLELTGDVSGITSGLAYVGAGLAVMTGLGTGIGQGRSRSDRTNHHESGGERPGCPAPWG